MAFAFRQDVFGNDPNEKECSIMLKRTRQAVAGLFVVGTLAVSYPVAAQVAIQDGLVNVAIGDVTVLENVAVGVAANVAANICGVNVGPVAVLGRAVDRSGDTRTVCQVQRQGNLVPVTISD
jgi:hypothetical protein